MSSITLYRGVSSIGIEEILAEGIHPYKTKYDEARAVLSKYINPEILTDEFLENNKNYIGSSFGNLGYRFLQFNGEGGVFCTRAIHDSDEDIRQMWLLNKDNPLHKALQIDYTEEYVRELSRKEEQDAVNGAISYAYNSANDFPEYERYMVWDLNSLSEQSLLELEEQIETAYMAGHLKGKGLQEQYDRLACRRKVLANVKSEYRDGKGGVKIPVPHGSYPVVLQIKGNDKTFSYQNNNEVRLVGDLKPEDIIGVAFAPEKMDELPVFISKEEFLKQLRQRQAADQQKTGSVHAETHETHRVTKKKGMCEMLESLPSDPHHYPQKTEQKTHNGPHISKDPDNAVKKRKDGRGG